MPLCVVCGLCVYPQEEINVEFLLNWRLTTNAFVFIFLNFNFCIAFYLKRITKRLCCTLRVKTHQMFNIQFSWTACCFTYGFRLPKACCDFYLDKQFPCKKYTRPHPSKIVCELLVAHWFAFGIEAQLIWFPILFILFLFFWKFLSYFLAYKFFMHSVVAFRWCGSLVQTSACLVFFLCDLCLSCHLYLHFFQFRPIVIFILLTSLPPSRFCFTWKIPFAYFQAPQSHFWLYLDRKNKIKFQSLLNYALRPSYCLFAWWIE